MAAVAAQRQGKQERVYSILRSRIVEGACGPGHRLVIDALARELEVSQMPVREAIRRLEAEGWVLYTRNQGAQVAPIDAVSWSEAMTTMAVLEGYATALAAPHVSRRDLDRMRAANRAMEAALRELDVAGASTHNLAFHGVIHARCPNAHIRRELTSIQERLNSLRNTIFSYIPARGEISVHEHAELLAMLEHGAEAAAIEAFAREHKLNTVAAFELRRAGAV
ncbi:MAG: GntR family transcriptional regulator [Solirubrobacterales bacterium]|nr:GntR family transcriptional regulator [Solirubrobacterales bacterium]MBV9714237.1 GntR family transcriptional regulator [Solirubrobacterales bacterium]